VQNTARRSTITVSADGKGLVSQAGALLLAETLRVTGLGAGLSAGLARWRAPRAVHHPGKILADLVVTLGLGGDCLADVAVLRAQPELCGPVASDPVISRLVSALAADAPRALRVIRKARAAARERAWARAGERAPGGDGSLIAVDLDATIVTAHSQKEEAAPTWKMGYGFHLLGAWAANTRECLAMLLRPGNAGSNTFADHQEVLAAAIRQVPARFRRKVLVRVDGAGASHELIRHLLSMSSPRRAVLFTCGWMITAADEDAIRQVPAGAWKPGTGQDGAIEENKDVAEITHLMSRAGNWPGGLRWIVRRVKPSRRQMRNLTAYQKKTGWRYSITCTNIPVTGIGAVAGSHHPQYIDVVHREHAVVETGGVRTAKATGLRNLPSIISSHPPPVFDVHEATGLST
jgi:Transposase DDE domain group 1